MLSVASLSLPLRQSSPPPYTAAPPSRRSPPPPLLSLSATASTSSGGRSEDDYHATLKTLNSKGRRTPRKSLGQHYMLNSTINEQLCAVAEVGEGDVVLEVGPGTGSLTNALINAGATVVAIEKDPHMAMLVRDRFGCTGRFTVLQEDITKCNFHSHISSLLDNKNSKGSELERAKVVSNIPFNISTDVIKRLLPMGNIFSGVVLLLQDEAALRLADFSLPTSEYRPINIFVNFYSNPEYKFKVDRTNFFPQPNVNSAFNSKRKMLRKSLQHICPSPVIEAALESVGLPVTVRPEELTLDEFVMLHNLLAERLALLSTHDNSKDSQEI